MLCLLNSLGSDHDVAGGHVEGTCGEQCLVGRLDGITENKQLRSWLSCGHWACAGGPRSLVCTMQVITGMQRVVLKQVQG